MATFVETRDCKILIDPGASIPALRFDLPPHPLEHWCLKNHRERIFLFAQDADLVVITHYDDTHFSPANPLIYKDKILLVKNPNQRIHVKERAMAFDFMKRNKGVPKEVTYIDGRTLRMGGTILEFSDPVSHGMDRDRWVIQVSVRDEEDRFVFTSDVEGLANRESTDFTIKSNPTFLYLDGPATYFEGNPAGRDPLEKILSRITSTIGKTDIQTLLIDHHLMRDVQWHDKIMPLYDFTRKKEIDLITVADYRGEDMDLLEARRRELYKDDMKRR